ncbi:MAG: hypothetical protein JNL34_08575, partial [Anaerolineae bacterium]|nr:hypothetical protein [Anaerolineae bacterium]
MAKRPYIPVKPVSEATTGEQITAFMFGLLVPSTALAIVALYIKSRFPKTGLFSWSLDQVEDRFLLGTVGLMLACVVLSIAFSISRKVLPFVMRQNALAKIRTKDRAEAKAHAARERERAAREAEHRLEQERREADRQRELAILTERTSWTNTANDLLAGTIADIFAVYRAATPEQRALIEHGYRERLAVAHPRSKYPTALPSVAALNHQARLLFLPAIIDADGSRQDYATLEFTGSDPAAARYLYTAHSGLPDLAHWEKAIPAINAYLGGSWRVERTGGAGIMLAALPAMQDTFPLVPAMLQHGEV